MMQILTAIALLAIAAPDSSYGRQDVEYRIEARLDEATNGLEGRARLRYGNRTPERIDTLYFHLYLNAFRPNSAWARRELSFGERRFQELGPEGHAYERVRGIRVDGEAVQPVYPGAPDSTVLAVPLASPLAPGGTVTVTFDWDARLSTLPRRQGRRGRHYDFAQWYPRIAVFDRGGWQYRTHLPQGEFNGEFGVYDVTLELAGDQVIGATGVPVEGDPGWAGAAAGAGTAIAYRRDAYGPVRPDPLGLLAAEAPPGHKRVRWRAEDVHHFAWSTAPDYVYEGSMWDGVSIHVLYQAGDTAWRGGTAVERTARALDWMAGIFAPYPYPQVTNVHRIEGGGTEFPMLVMNGSASQGLIVHEVAHIYAHGILANNEWLEGWLDEGMASFLTSWFAEQAGAADVWANALAQAAAREQAGRTQPVSTPSADFVDFAMYQAMTYTKPQLVLRMLRDHLGEATFRRGLRTYYERNRFRRVTGADLQAAMETAGGRDLDWFFDQWIRGTATLDHALGAVRTRRLADGRWRTAVEVLRLGEAWMPVVLRVGDVTRRLESRDRRQVVEVETATRPGAVVLDPDRVLLDANPANNRAVPAVVDS